MPPKPRKKTKAPRAPASPRPPAKAKPIAGFFLPTADCQAAVDAIKALVKLTPEPLEAAISSGADVVTRKLLSLQPVLANPRP